MRFIQSGLSVFLALSSFSTVLAAPTLENREILIPDEAALKVLTGPTDLTARGENLPVPDDSALKVLLGDVNARHNTRAKRDPPTYKDFKNFFKRPEVAAQSGHLVFWSGVGEDGSKAFANNHMRNTLEMLIDKFNPAWRDFMGLKEEGGYWDSNEARVKGFFTKASTAYAEFATGEVIFVAGSWDVPEFDQSKDACKTCWRVTEKPILLDLKANGKVKSISMYVHDIYDHEITKMENK